MILSLQSPTGAARMGGSAFRLRTARHCPPRAVQPIPHGSKTATGNAICPCPVLHHHCDRGGNTRGGQCRAVRRQSTGATATAPIHHRRPIPAGGIANGRLCAQSKAHNCLPIRPLDSFRRLSCRKFRNFRIPELFYWLHPYYVQTNGEGFCRKSTSL